MQVVIWSFVVVFTPFSMSLQSCTVFHWNCRHALVNHSNARLGAFSRKCGSTLLIKYGMLSTSGKRMCSSNTIELEESY